MKLHGRAIMYVLLAVVIFAIVYGFMPKPALVETAKVQRGYMRFAIEEEGRTRVMNRFVVSAQVAGFARRIDLKIGDSVSKGQIIATLEPLRANVLDPRSRAEAHARVAAADASLRAANENSQAAKASAEFAKKDLDRITHLFNEAIVTQETLDKAETEMRRTDALLRSSEFAVDVALHEKEAASAALNYSAARKTGNTTETIAIKAPVIGRVLKINHESEGIVREGEALIEIGDPHALEVEVDVLSADAVRIRPGTPVLFDRWGGDKPLQGSVRTIEPAGFTKVSALGVEEQRVLVISDIVSPHEDWTLLGDGYRVEASFTLWEGENVLQVPASALFRIENGWAVFVIRNKKAQLRQVQTGCNNALDAEIISGLSEGEMVIPHPDSAIKDGSRVRPRSGKK